MIKDIRIERESYTTSAYGLDGNKTNQLHYCTRVKGTLDGETVLFMVEDGDTQEESDARLKRRVKNIIDANENAQQILSLLEPFSADDTKTAVEATISCSSYYVALYLYENNVSSEDFILNNPESYLIYNLLRNFEVGVYNPEDSKFRLVKR